MTAKFTKAKRVVRGLQSGTARPSGASSFASGQRARAIDSRVGTPGGFIKTTKCLHRGVTVGDARKDKTHACNCTSCGLAFDGFLADGRVIVKGGTR